MFATGEIECSLIVGGVDIPDGLLPAVLKEAFINGELVAPALRLEQVRLY